MAEILEMEVKSNIGEVTKDVDKATKSLKKLDKENEGIAKSSKKASKGFAAFGKGLKGIGKILGGLGIIAIVAAAFTALKDAMTKNQGVMDTISSITTTISTTFNQLVNVITDTVHWVTESSKRFDGMGKVLTSLKTLAITPIMLAFNALKLTVQGLMLSFLKIKDAIPGENETRNIRKLKKEMKETKRSLKDTAKEAKKAALSLKDNFVEAISEVTDIYEKASGELTKISIKANYEQAKASTAAVKSAMFAQAEFSKLNAQKLKEAELLRQIRDDETETFAARIKANKELKKSLEEQEKLQRAQIQKQITAAALLVEQNGNDENRLALMEAQNAELELEEAITGQLSEQKTNAVGLERELLEVQRTLRAEGLSGMQRELEELQTAYDEKVEMARKAEVDITAITAQFEADKLRIKKEAADKEKALDKAVRDAKVGMAQSGLKLISAIAGEGTVLAKTAAVAQATISGVQGVQNAFTSGVGNLPMMAATGGSYGFIQAGLAGAFSAVQIAKILNGTPAGGGGAGGGGVETSIPAPQMMSGAFDISGGVAPEPIQAFVLTDSMTNSQNQLANIRRRATI